MRMASDGIRKRTARSRPRSTPRATTKIVSVMNSVCQNASTFQLDSMPPNRLLTSSAPAPEKRFMAACAM